MSTIGQHLEGANSEKNEDGSPPSYPASLLADLGLRTNTQFDEEGLFVMSKFVDPYFESDYDFDMNDWHGRGKSGMLVFLENYFEPYILKQKDFLEHVNNEKTAHLALEILRRTYEYLRTFEKDTWPYRDGNSSQISLDPEFFSAMTAKVLDILGSYLHRTDLPSQATRRFKENIYYVVSEAQDTNNASTRACIEAWQDEYWEDFQTMDPFFKYPDDNFNGNATLDTYKNIFLRSDNEELAHKSLISILRMYYSPIASESPQQVKSSFIEPILRESMWRNYQALLRRRQLITSMAQRYGLDSYIERKWRHARTYNGKNSQGKDEFIDSSLINLDAVEQLEMTHPGGAAILYKNYGIANFARYGHGMLTRQLEIEGQDAPYGVIVYPEADKNGAFFENGKILYKAHLKLRMGGYETRIVEAGSKQELARRLLRLHNGYSPAGNKFSFAIIGGHGNAQAIALGNKANIFDSFPSQYKNEPDQERVSENQGKLQSEDVEEGRGIQRALGEWLEPGVPIILVSCSTGSEGGIAEKLSAKTKGEVIAPSIPTYLSEILVTFDKTSGKPQFDVRYGKDHPVRHYIAGNSREDESQ